VVELGRYPDLAQEALRSDGDRQLGAQHLDRDIPFVLEIVGEEDGGHATAAQRTLDGVAIGECGSDSGQLVRHRSPRCCAVNIAARLEGLYSGVIARSMRENRRPLMDRGAASPDSCRFGWFRRPPQWLGTRSGLPSFKYE
jgi:hypothetical protein